MEPESTRRKRPGGEPSAEAPDRSHLSVQEVAQRWGVSVNYVRRLLWDRKLSFTRFGRSIRVPLSAVEKFANTNTLATESRRIGLGMR